MPGQCQGMDHIQPRVKSHANTYHVVHAPLSVISWLLTNQYVMLLIPNDGETVYEQCGDGANVAGWCVSASV
jgi:hypothetical protein